VAYEGVAVVHVVDGGEVAEDFLAVAVEGLDRQRVQLADGFGRGNGGSGNGMRSIPAKMLPAVPCFRAWRSAPRARPKRMASLFACVAFPGAVIVIPGGQRWCSRP